MEALSGRASRDSLGDGGRHNMLSALPPPPMPMGMAFFAPPPPVNTDYRNTTPFGHLAPLQRKPDAATLLSQPAPLSPQPRLHQSQTQLQAQLDLSRAPSLQQQQSQQLQQPLQPQLETARSSQLQQLQQLQQPPLSPQQQEAMSRMAALQQQLEVARGGHYHHHQQQQQQPDPGRSSGSLQRPPDAVRASVLQRPPLPQQPQQQQQQPDTATRTSMLLQQAIDAARAPQQVLPQSSDMPRTPSALQQLLEVVRAPTPAPTPAPVALQPEAPRRTVQAYRKRQLDGGGGPRPVDFGAGHVAGMLVRPEGDVPNLPPRSGTGMRLRPARLPPCCCVPPPNPEPLVPPDDMLLQVLRMHDQRRLVNPAQVANVIVYDCIERPPRSSSEPTQEATAAAGAGGEAAAEAAAGTAEAAGGGAGGGSSSGAGGGGAAGKRVSSSNGEAGGGGVAAGQGGRGSAEGEAAGASGTAGAATGGAAAAAPGAAGGAAGEEGASSTPSATTAAAAAAAAASRGAAGPPSCSYSRPSMYDYFEDMPAWYCPRGPSDHTLVFESRYESGNLRRAIQVYPYEYDLILRPDINTRGHTQWFYFAVSNTRAGCRYKFNIINLLKEESLYNLGMQPLVHSAKAQAARGLGWHRAGSRICYYANSIRRGRQGRSYFTLTFTLTTEFDNDLVHLAHCYPYTYTDLQRYIRALELDPVRRPRVRRETLATSLAGNAVDVLTVTSPTEDAEALRRRKAVIITARVHPGESNASWMMKGLLDFLLGPSLDARILREAFVFKIVPMLNPDGVITGNYRCSLAGVDLNRVWNDPSRKLHPVIFATKLYLKQLAEEREVVMFADLHGHSKKLDVFMYGCEKKLPRDGVPAFPGWPVPGSVGGQTSIPARFQDKLLPLLIHHNAPDLFSYHNCSFKVQKSKIGTSRVVGFRELGLVNSFTVEASFAGPSGGRWAKQHFTTSHLEQQGAALLLALLDYWDPEAYGYGELLGQLDFLHPANGESPPRFITTPDGQLVEVEDEEPPTDSDDESSDDGGGAGGAAGRGGGGASHAARARTAHRGRSASGGVAFMQQYYNAYGMSVGGAPGGGPGTAPPGAGGAGAAAAAVNGGGGGVGAELAGG
ncbi:hypothetical protein Agub_g9210, partial [Astrephomene gubernaculifera]